MNGYSLIVIFLCEIRPQPGDFKWFFVEFFACSKENWKYFNLSEQSKTHLKYIYFFSLSLSLSVSGLFILLLCMSLCLNNQYFVIHFSHICTQLCVILFLLVLFVRSVCSYILFNFTIVLWCLSFISLSHTKVEPRADSEKSSYLLVVRDLHYINDINII